MHCQLSVHSAEQSTLHRLHGGSRGMQISYWVMSGEYLDVEESECLARSNGERQLYG